MDSTYTPKIDPELNYLNCLKAHYKRNDHHPEHYEKPEMKFEARMELTCELLGTVMGWAHNRGLKLNLAECRAVIEKANWESWDLAVKDKLPEPTEIDFNIHGTWHNKTYSIDEFKKLECYEDLDELKCVRDYVDDLLKHKLAVYQVWRDITEYDKRYNAIAERIQNHDLDKFRIDMLRAYTMKLSEFRGKTKQINVEETPKTDDETPKTDE